MCEVNTWLYQRKIEDDILNAFFYAHSSGVFNLAQPKRHF